MKIFNMQINRTVIDPILLTSIAVFFPFYTVYWICTNFNIQSLLTFFSVTWILGASITMFVHRAWSHRAWIPNKAVNFIGMLLFTLSLTGTTIGWVSVHREHHRHSDTDKDPHSPYFKSRWYVQFLNYYSKIHVQYITDLLRDPMHLWFAKNYWYINFAFMLGLYFIDPSWLLLWIACAGNHVLKMHTINSLTHNAPRWVLPTTQGFGASNSLLLMVLHGFQGEALHKNHHDDPRNWNFRRHWYEIDLPGQIILLLSKLGLARLNHSSLAPGQSSG